MISLTFTETKASTKNMVNIKNYVIWSKVLLWYNNQIVNEKGAIIPVCGNTLSNFLVNDFTELNDNYLPSKC